MNDLFMARCQMGMSLAFHIVFAAIGIGLPLMMCIAEGLWLRTGEDVYHELAKRWSKIAAILFAVGAVSGTVLSFELGLLWPKFMEWSGEIIGLPFALEGFAFFTEAIFLGIYLYGWNLVPRAVHLASGVIVAISGLLSGLFVVLANGWMNTPTGFRIESAGKIIDPSVAASNPSLANFSLGKPVEIDPVAAMLNPAGLPEAIHMLFACYAATAFLFAGIHAYCLFKDKKNLFHRRAVAISLAVGAVMAILQPLTGDALAKMVAERQPVKLAAFESLFDTKYGAPLLIGGVPDVENAVVNYAIEIPHALSFLAYSDFNAKVKGLKEFPRELWPNIPIVHYCFQIMVASGMIMSLVSLWAGIHYVRRRKLLDTKAFLWSLTACAPLGFLAIETGWLVTEVGRQPWVIQGVMRTKDAVTPMPGLMVPFLTFTVLYLFLAVIVVFLIRRQVVKSPVIRDEQEPEVLPDPSVTPHANEDDMVEDAKTENASTDAGEASTNAGEASAEAEPAPADAKPPSVDGEPVPEDSKKDEP